MTPEARLQVQEGGPVPTVAPGHRQNACTGSTSVEQAIHRAVSWLLSAQHRDGYWWGELEADTTLESDYILYLHILGELNSKKVLKLATYIRDRQLPDGGWNIFYDGPSELNATVKAWVALRLAGDSACSPHLERACKKIHELGGLESTNSYVRFYLAMVGAIDWSMVPAIPPEIMLLPTWFPVNLYEMSSWTRGIVIPLAIVHALKPDWRLPAGVAVDELFTRPGAAPPSLKWDVHILSWKNFFLALDRCLKLYERLPWNPLRRLALARARQWMLERLERSEGLGTIYPAMMNSIFALFAECGDRTDPLLAREVSFLERYEIEQEGSLRVQPCISPLWDTAIAMVSLEEAGLDPSHEALLRAARWLVRNQILGPGDWRVKNQKAAPGGWAFEFRNDFYPDVDDTAFVLMALSRIGDPQSGPLRAAMRRGLAWLVSMQNRDGGWGAFDHENNLDFLNNIPFADHNAMLDPSCPDITARSLEALGQYGIRIGHHQVNRAIRFIEKTQDRRGCWLGRWGVNYIYGTWQVLSGLYAAGCDMSKPMMQRAVAWLKKVQQANGGWGESCYSYNDPKTAGQGPVTASQTAWALLGLLAAGEGHSQAVKNGIEYLLRTQGPDGNWREDQFTGTGFPKVFYLKYHLYRLYFPLMALARYQASIVHEGHKGTRRKRGPSLCSFVPFVD